MEFSRADRLQSQIVKEITEIIAMDLRDRPPCMITITRSEMSRDLRHAKVLFTVLGSEEMIDKALVYLKKHVNVIRHFIGQRMRIKHLPELLFQYDTGGDNTSRILNILEQLKKEDEQKTD